MVKKRSLDASIKQKVNIFSKQLTGLNFNVSQLIVFGSQVKKKAKPWSDIDVCVVSRKFGYDRQSERVKLMKARSKETREIEPHPYNPDDLQDKWDPLATEIRKYGVVV